MALILFILGFVLAGAGTAMIGFGIPINEFTLGTTLIIAGTTALAGGLILIGLSAVVTELARVVEGLKSRAPARAAASEPAVHGPSAMAYPAAPPAPAPHQVAAAPAPPSPRPAPAAPPLVRRPELPVRQELPVRPTEPYPAPAAPAASAVEVSSAAIERLRSSIPRGERPRAEMPAPPPPPPDYEEVPLSPNGAAPPRARPVAPPEPREAAEGQPSDPSKKSRLDFLFRTKPSGRPGSAAQAESLEPAWPPEGREPAERVPEPVRPPEPRGTAILKSGVVDGMAYTLYADGSIEAKLPQGTVRFGSIAELRSHIEHNS
jgi:hypothetical protein